MCTAVSQTRLIWHKGGFYKPASFLIVNDPFVGVRYNEAYRLHLPQRVGIGDCPRRLVQSPRLNQSENRKRLMLE